MLEEITSRQLSEWMAYNEIEPFGEDRDDLRMGIIASTIANVNRSNGKKPYKPQDFMPVFKVGIETEEEAGRRLAERARRALGRGRR